MCVKRQWNLTIYKPRENGSCRAITKVGLTKINISKSQKVLFFLNFNLTSFSFLIDIQIHVYKTPGPILTSTQFSVSSFRLVRRKSFERLTELCHLLLFCNCVLTTSVNTLVEMSNSRSTKSTIPNQYIHGRLPLPSILKRKTRAAKNTAIRTTII